MAPSLDPTHSPELAAVHVFGVTPQHIPHALLRMARDGRALRSVPGLTFARLLGTNNGTTFTARSNDFRHWALVSVWQTTEAAQDFELSTVIRRWTHICEERLRVRLRPLTSRGRWAGREPFGAPTPHPVSGPVASITRARIAPRKAVQFWRAVPPVATDLAQAAGVRLAIGVGEAPLGFQG
ncbi:MAG: monooxygenase, partial [Actinomycetota bacterium]|nr:monooxygenase [Actinomycetota bacterium]